MSVSLTALQSAEKFRSTYKESFLFGTSAVDITPPMSHPQRRGASTGIGSPLFAKAMVFKQGNNAGAILTCDLVLIPENLSRIVREKVTEITGIPYEHISITATHTHNSPRIAIDTYARKKDNGTLTQKDKNSYVAQLIDSMVNAIVIAYHNLNETEIISGISRVEGIAFNRRYLMSDGTVRTNPGPLNPQIIEPAGPVDNEVHFVLFKMKKEKSFTSSLTVFACHTATKGGTDFHADYPHYIEVKLKECFGDDFISVFGIGASGNVNTTDVVKPRSERGNVTEKLGSEIAKSIIEDFDRAANTKVNFRVISRIIDMPLQNISQQDLEWARGEIEIPNLDKGRLSEVRKAKIIHLDYLKHNSAIPPSACDKPWLLPIELQVFRLSKDVAIIAIPGELFVELGLEIKKRSPFANTLVITLANTHISYIPTKQAFSEGGYEVVNSRLGVGSGEKLVDEIVTILNEIDSTHNY